jgi:hypothetical protein
MGAAMFDIELLRRLNSGAAMSEADVAQGRGGKDYQEPAFFEAAKPRHAVPNLTDGEVAQLISAQARDAVIGFEVSSRKDYERNYIHPEAPAGESGVTIGIGYDLGYNSEADVRSHWQGLLGDGEIERLVKACGLRGATARACLRNFRDISVPWDAAIEVYQRSTMPRFGRKVLTTFPNAIETKGHAFGALFSLIYNRGESLQGEPRREMAAIRDLMEQRAFAKVPDQILAMKRIWEGRPGLRGVLIRRDAEAILFKRGLELMRTPAAAMDQLTKAGMFVPLPGLMTPAITGPGAEFEAAGGTSASLEARQATDDWHYQLGLYEVATRREGRGIDDSNLEALGGANLEFGMTALKAIGTNVARDLELKLKDYVCKQANQRADGVRLQIDDATAKGSLAVRQFLTTTLSNISVILPRALIEPVVDVVMINVVEPALGNTGKAALGQIGQGSDWLCQTWTSNIVSRYAAPGAAASDPKPASQPEPQSFVAVPAAAGPDVAMPVATVVPASNTRVLELFASIQQAVAGDRPNWGAAQRYIKELNDESGQTGQPLTAEQFKTLLTVVADPRYLQSNQDGPDVLAQVDQITAVLNTIPVDKAGLEIALEQLHRDLGDARLQVPLATVKALLRSLRNARQFDQLSRIADRLITRDPALLGALSVPYAQGLIDGGRLIAGIEVLTAAEQSGALTREEAAEVDGLLGRAHKQIYLNFVRTQSDAKLLAKDMGPHLVASVAHYAKRYDPAHPGDTYYHGINVAALQKRAQRDGIAVTATCGDPDSIARAIIPVIEPAAEIGNDVWEIVTLGEAYLAIGDLENAAKWYGRFAKHPKVSAFELSSAVRQLEEVWQLSATQTGAGAIVTGLKTVLAFKDGGSVTLKPKEQRALANAQAVQFEKHFETKTDGGEFINFGLLKQIVHCGNAVAAVQKPVGQSWVNHGTAFLVKGSDFSPDLSDEKSYLLTNAHVMWDFDQPGDGNSAETSGSPVDWRQVRIVFESHQGDGRAEPYACARVVWQSPSSRHDAVLFELREAVPRERAVPLAMAGREFPLRAVEPNGAPPTRLSVLGHPGGRELAISFIGSIQQNNAILVDKGPRDANGEPVFLHYSTPTEGGNSGSPVFSADTWRVVALHHAGFPDQGRPKLGGKLGSNLANEGIWIESIRAAVKAARSPQDSGRPRWWNKGRSPSS